MDSLVPLMHHDPDRSWITYPDPDHPKGMYPKTRRRTRKAGKESSTTDSSENPKEVMLSEM